VPGFVGPLTLHKFSAGQSNPTYRVEAASGRYVLRCQPLGQLLKSAHAVDREFRVQRALADSAVPVPRMLHLCEDREVIGVKFCLMSHVDGAIHQDPALPEVPREQRAGYYQEAVRILAALHAVDVSGVGLDDFGRPGSYFKRQVAVWSKQYRASETRPIEAMDKLMSWVERHCPADDGQVALVHGDFRLDNLVFAHDGPSGKAVLDWELSTLGHPLADIAYFCMCLRIPPGDVVFGLGGLDRGTLGIPSETELVEQYCAQRKIYALDHWPFCIAFSFFRLAAILQGVYRRALDGNASHAQAERMGDMVEQLALMALAATRE
jgi:aminoglycoside phosphotransferase (APT) family kinase protein